MAKKYDNFWKTPKELCSFPTKGKLIPVDDPVRESLEMITNMEFLFTTNFQHQNINKLLSSKYFSGVIDGFPLINKIKQCKGCATIIISKTGMYDYLIWVVETGQWTTEKKFIPFKNSNDEGTFIEIIPHDICMIGFYAFNPKFEGMLYNVFLDFPELQADKSIKMDRARTVDIDWLITNWENWGIMPMSLK